MKIVAALLILICIGFYACKDQPMDRETKPAQKVLKLDQIQKDGKFISPRQMSAVTGDDNA